MKFKLHWTLLLALSIHFISAVSPNSTVSPLTFNKPNRSDEAATQLVQLQLLFRHGDRTPYWIYKNDRYKESDFWEGIGELVNRGKERLFQYGKVLRNRYSDYVDDILIKNINAQSSPIRRCLETSLALLAGLVPPTKEAVWSRSIRWPEIVLAKIWQPIAVTTVEESRSWKLNPDAECPAATKIEKEMETKGQLKKFLDENHQFILQLSNATGEDFLGDPKLGWLWVGYLYDTLWTEQQYFGPRYQPPEWLSTMPKDTMTRLSAFNDLVFSVYGNATAFLKLRAGTLLKEMIDNMKEVRGVKEVTAKNRTLFAYGSHDTFIAYVLQALGLYKSQPTYGSGLILELRRHSATSAHQVHLFYSNLTSNGPANNVDIYRLQLNESERFSSYCKQSYCELESFEAALTNYLEDDAERDCKVAG